MPDHVARMVHSWFERVRTQDSEREATTHLIDSIHRLIREAESQTRKRCEEVALHTARAQGADQVALAIRALGAQPSAEARPDE